jgi:hypothetical protein
MPVLVETHPAFAEQNAGPGHPERPERLDAVLEGIERLDLDALRGGTEAGVGTLVGVDRRPEPPTSGGPGMGVVDAAADLRSS